MRKTVLALLLCSSAATATFADDWSVGIATGPFVFGDFVRRTMTIGNGSDETTVTNKLSASTRAGLSIDVERGFSDRFAVRAEGTFTQAPLAIKGGGEELAIGAGKMNVGTFMLPLLFRINPNGTFRFHVMAGPAYAAYRVTRRPNAALTINEFAGTRGRFGLAAGAGLSWNWSRRFAVEGQIVDISTSSPFERTDFPQTLNATIDIPRPHNVHTTVGVRVRF